MVSLASMYFVGHGVTADDAAAARWYLAAARAGDTGSQYIIASMYEKGEGIEQDARLAAHWYLQAASQGDPVAQAKYDALTPADADTK